MTPNFRVRPPKGFTLIEILLVIAILMGVGVLEMRKDVAKAKEAASIAVGKQMAIVAKASEQYMATKSSALQAMTDPNCPATGNSCSLSMGALIGEGYLPADFLNKVQFGGDYTVKVLRAAPPTPPEHRLARALPRPPPDAPANNAA